MPTYRERREAKAARLQEWAAKREAKANAIEHADAKLREDLNFVAAQPGIGRSTIFKRTNARQEKEFEHLQKARAMGSRAAGIEEQLDRAIYDDDPDAIERLEERIAQLEAKQEQHKAANAVARRDNKAALAAMTPYERSQAVPYPSYSISNLGADIRRNKERLAKLQREAEHGESARYLYDTKYEGTCRDCGATIAKGSSARYFKRAGEVACYPACTPAPEATSCETVKRLDIFGEVHDTYQTEAQLNGWRESQGSLF